MHQIQSQKQNCDTKIAQTKIKWLIQSAVITISSHLSWQVSGCYPSFIIIFFCYFLSEIEREKRGSSSSSIYCPVLLWRLNKAQNFAAKFLSKLLNNLLLCLSKSLGNIGPVYNFPDLLHVVGAYVLVLYIQLWRILN